MIVNEVDDSDEINYDDDDDDDDGDDDDGFDNFSGINFTSDAKKAATLAVEDNIR